MPIDTFLTDYDSTQTTLIAYYEMTNMVTVVETYSVNLKNGDFTCGI